MAGKSMDIQQAVRLAVQYHQKGQYSKANQLYTTILGIDPNNSAALHGLGILQGQQGLFNEALANMKNALNYEPNNSALNNNIGEVYRRMGDIRMAENHYTRAINLDAFYPDPYKNLGIIYKNEGKIEDSVYCYKKAIELDPKDPFVYSSLAGVYSSVKDFDKALENYDKSIELNPNFIESIVNKGLVLYETGDFEECEKCFRRAVELKPDFHFGKVNLAMLMLRRKDFRDGLKYLEARFDANPAIIEFDIKKMYRNGSLKEKTICIYNEKIGFAGFGDIILFSRYINDFIEETHVEKVFFRIPEQLVSYFKGNVHEKVEIVDSISEDDFDFHLPLMSLPYSLRARAKNIPFTEGYIKPDPEKLAEWKEKIGTDGLKIGFVFASDVADRRVREKISLDSEAFKYFTGIEGAKLFSFQVDRDGDKLQKTDWAVDLVKDFTDLSDTCAAASCMDFFVCVDSDMAHVAAASGVKVELVLNRNHDWRWISDKDGVCLWYSNMNITIAGEGEGLESAVKKVAKRVKG